MDERKEAPQTTTTLHCTVRRGYRASAAASFVVNASTADPVADASADNVAEPKAATSVMDNEALRRPTKGGGSHGSQSASINVFGAT